MTTFLTFLGVFATNPQEALYITEAMLYGIVFWLSRSGRRTPPCLYLVSAVVFLMLGLLHRYSCWLEFGT